jgi:4-amino-4-deoxy-L-arabinose transferase-like glycosyltransferase
MTSKTWKGECLVLILLAVLVILLRLPSLEEPFDNDSGANAYHARLIMRGEPLYGTHHPAHHMPAVYYIYAFAFWLLGDSTWSVKFFLIPWLIVTSYLIYRFGIRFDRTTGLLGAVFFVILTSHLWLKGTTAEIELFVNLPRAAVILLVLRLDQEKGREWAYIFVGLLSGVAFLFKAIYLDSLLISGIVILIGFLKHKDQNGRLWSAFLRSCWVGIGFICSILPVFLYFYLTGLWPRFLMIFKLGSSYSSVFLLDTSILLIFVAPLMILAINNVLLLIVSIIGMINLSFQTRKKWLTDDPAWMAPVVMVIWYALSWFVAGFSKFGFVHYGILAVPPLSLTAAWGLSLIHKNYVARKGTTRWFSIRSPGLLLFIAILIISAVVNARVYYHYSQYLLGHETRKEFLKDGSPVGAEYITLLGVIEHIQAATTQEEFIYAWTDQAQIYYYTDRRAPVEVPWPVYAQAFGSYKRIFVPNTKYIILGESMMIARPDWLYVELNRNYELEQVIGEYEIYRRTNERGY